MSVLRTDFTRLAEAVRWIGISVTDQAKISVVELETGVDVKSDGEYISAPSGFFDLLPNGDVVRLILHLASYHGAARRGATLHNPESWHKYHLTPCSSIKGAPPSRQQRYIKTRRSDGRFHYAVLNSHGVEVDQQETKRGRVLQLCGSCRNKIANLMGFFEFENEFNLAQFLEGYASVAMRFESNAIKYDEDTVYYFKPDDWHEIAQYAKERCGWRCTRCHRDCSPHRHRKFLHAHYRDGILRGTVANVSPLCLACHAKQPGANHRLIRNRPLYREFRDAFP